MARLRDTLARHPAVPPDCLEFELLESNATAKLEHVARVIEDCRQLGVKFALDDFGTGYSSLTCLKKLPVVRLKIDQSFVHDMRSNPNDLAIVTTIVSLARMLGIEAVAKGVETVEDGVELLRLGCELGQGYGIARPMPAAELPHWVQTWRPEAAWCELAWVA